MRKEEYTANAHKMIIIIILLFSLVFMPFHGDDEHILKESAMLLQFMFRLCENVIAILGRRWCSGGGRELRGVEDFYSLLCK